jgi:glycosyltransferase involved in cell wall biosynthesis
VARDQLQSFDLVVATVDRVEAPRRLLASLEHQTHQAFRVLLVDQNPDGRLDELVDRRGSPPVVRLRAPRGLSRARNVGLEHLQAELVAFPDDDCTYPEDLLELVAQRFAADPTLDGLTGRAADADGRTSRSWARDAAELTRENLWNRAISFTIFLRASAVAAVGGFDEQLGLGSGLPWSSGEETDYLVRAVDKGMRVVYDPDLVVLHDDKTYSPDALRTVGAREGASVGYILRKNGYSARTVGRMFARPFGGAVVAFTRGDTAQALFQLSTLRGRLRGYRAAT